MIVGISICHDSDFIHSHTQMLEFVCLRVCAPAPVWRALEENKDQFTCTYKIYVQYICNTMHRSTTRNPPPHTHTHTTRMYTYTHTQTRICPPPSPCSVPPSLPWSLMLCLLLCPSLSTGLGRGGYWYYCRNCTQSWKKERGRDQEQEDSARSSSTWRQ